MANLDDIENAEGAFRGRKPRGLLRVEVQGTLARHFLFPALPAFLARYPDVEIAMSERDRWVDVVREGVDCVLRYGALPDSDLVARTLTALPGHLRCAKLSDRHGVPYHPDDLENHRAVGLRSRSTGALPPFDFNCEGETRRMSIAAPFSATGTENFREGVLSGLGLAQMPVFHIERDLSEGRLVQVLSEFPPLSVLASILYPTSRQLSARVRLFIDWAIQQFGAREMLPDLPWRAD